MARNEKVIRVIDRDTFETASRRNPVCLANVDAPEKGIPGSAVATKALCQMVEGKKGSGDQYRGPR